MFKLEEPEQNKISRFLLTVNPNKAYTNITAAREGRRVLEAKLKSIFASFEDYIRVYQREGRKMVRVDVPLESITSEARIKTQSEIGSKQHRLHNHSLVSITHDGEYSLRINLPKLRSALPEGIHVDIKFVRDPQFTLEKYIYKSQEK